MLCFFFFKQKTAYEMRISDWSSDVCSSDLLEVVGQIAAPQDRPRRRGVKQAVPEEDAGDMHADHLAQHHPGIQRPALKVSSAERRVGKECGSTCRSR